MTSLASLLPLLVAALLTGCAGNYYDQYKRANPDWYPAFPNPGASLEETLASLHAPNSSNSSVMIRKLQIFRTDVDPWEKILLPRQKNLWVNSGSGSRPSE